MDNNTTYAVLFSGELRKGVNLQQAQQGVAALFKVDTTKIERLFQPVWVSIRKGLEKESALKYRQALAKAGIVVHIVADGDIDTFRKQHPPHQHSADKVSIEPEAADPSLVSTAESEPIPSPDPSADIVTRSEIKRPPSPENLVTADSELVRSVVKELSEAATNINLETSGDWRRLQVEEEIAPLEVDLSALEIREGGSLQEPDPFIPLEIDLSDLTLDEPGVILKEPEPFHKIEVDTSHLNVEK